MERSRRPPTHLSTLLLLGLPALFASIGGCNGPSPTVEQHRESPAWSPDGQTLAFEAERGGQWDLAITEVDTETTALTFLTTHPSDDVTPAWSPDGTRIAFASDRAGTRDLYLLDVASRATTQVTDLPGREGRPTWSPDGSELAFHGTARDGSREIFVIGTDGEDLRQLTDAHGNSDWASWSADGSTIHFESDRSGTWEIYAVPAGGGDPQQRTTSGAGAPVLSPDGRLLAGQARRDGAWQIITIDTGGHETDLTSSPSSDRLPAWAPNGHRLTFISNRDGPLDVYIMNADGSGVRRLPTQAPGAVCLGCILEEKGPDQARQLARTLAKTDPAGYPTIERQLNELGYRHLSGGAVGAAITTFRLAAELFPDSANVHDSLGEGLLVSGDAEAALASYQRSLELDPDNRNGRAMIERIRLRDAEWRQWGGPNRTFRSFESNLLERWPEGGPPLRWEVTHPGNYGSLVIDEGRVFGMFKETAREEIVRSLDAADGDTIWAYRYTVPESTDDIVPGFGLGPNAGPLVIGDRLITMSFFGQLHAFDKADGRVLWSVDTMATHGAKLHMFGYSISPMTYDDKIIVPIGGRDHGVLALDPADGTVVWASEPIDVSYASPMLLNQGGSDQIVLMASTEVVGLDPNDGSILWRHAHENLNKNNCSTPLWGDDGRLFLSSHSDGGAEVVALTGSGPDTTVEQVWKNDRIFFFHTSNLRIGDTVFGASGTWSPTELVAIDVPTGNILWSERGFDKANLLLAEGKTYILAEDGTLSLADMSRHGLRVISSFQPLEETAWAPPAISSGTLYLRDQHRVRAYDIRRTTSATALGQAGGS